MKKKKKNNENNENNNERKERPAFEVQVTYRLDVLGLGAQALQNEIKTLVPHSAQGHLAQEHFYRGGKETEIEYFGDNKGQVPKQEL